MTIYLRTQNNRTLVDIEIWKAKDGNFFEIKVGIPIEEYSNFLLLNQNQSGTVIECFSDIDNMPGWYWENYIEKKPSHTMKEVVEEINKLFLLPISKHFNLEIIKD